MSDDQPRKLRSAECNLNSRVETVMPVEDPTLKSQLDEILAAYDRDNCSVWDCGPDDVYVLRSPTEGQPRRAVQETLIRRASHRDQPPPDAPRPPIVH